MSFFTDFLVADPNDADAIAKFDNPVENWQGHSVKSIGELDMANLYSILSSDEDPVELLDDFECLCFPDEHGEGMVVHGLPSRFVDLLATVQDEELSKVCDRWAACEEFRGLWESKHLIELLKQLRELAASSKKDSQCLLLCTSGV